MDLQFVCNRLNNRTERLPRQVQGAACYLLSFWRGARASLCASEAACPCQKFHQLEMLSGTAGPLPTVRLTSRACLQDVAVGAPAKPQLSLLAHSPQDALQRLKSQGPCKSYICETKFDGLPWHRHSHPLSTFCCWSGGLHRPVLSHASSFV